MKIPKSFKLNAKTFTVTIVPKAKWADESSVAYFDPSSDQIHIMRDTKERMTHAWFHELGHAILYTMGRAKLFEDEAFVDMYAGLIQQALSTAE